MAATSVDICNIALGHIGITQGVANIAVPSTKEEKACARLYDHARKLLLTRYKWKFAFKRAILAEATGVTPDGWLYAYTLPADFLDPRKLFVSLVNEATDQKAPFDIINKDDASARVLVCNLQPVTNASPILHYTYNVSTTTLFPAYFDDALAWFLADLLCMPIRVEPNIARLVAQRSKLEISNALADDQSQEQNINQPDAEHIRARE